MRRKRLPSLIACWWRPRTVTVPDRQAVALRCDPEGIVERLLVDEIGAGRHVGPGRSFLDAVDPLSKDEVRNLLSTVVREFAVLDREIRLRGSDAGPPAILHVAGLVMPANTPNSGGRCPLIQCSRHPA